MPNINKKNASSSEKTEISTKSTEEKLNFLKKTCYSNKVIQLYVNRVNAGKIENADIALASTGSCGDTVKFYFKIKENNPMENASFRYIGCPASAACGSILTQIVKGISLEKAEEIKENEILKELGGLPDDKYRCARLAVATLHKTIAMHERHKQQISKSKSLSTGKIV
jgi:NifU-like protein involved in Fe-S cluster formation